jgi:Zn finger protein HypA/HybF involved in hydrogenase expression
MSTSTLKRRVEALEQAHGGGECPRCSGTTVIIVNGRVESVNRSGQMFTPEEAEAFVREEKEGGRCPVCGSVRATIAVGGEGWRGSRQASR